MQMYLTLINKETRKFKIFYDQDKKINCLQDLSYINKYELTEFEGANLRSSGIKK
ncbi:hypothetical protein D3C87_1705250 [compost metagenome]